MLVYVGVTGRPQSPSHYNHTVHILTLEQIKPYIERPIVHIRHLVLTAVIL